MSDSARITPWHETYRQLLFSVGERARELRRAIVYLFSASAVQGVALACLYPLLQSALLTEKAAALFWLLSMTVLMLLASSLRWRGQDFDYSGNMLEASHTLRLKLGEQLRRMPLLKLQEKRSGEVTATLLGNVDENLMYSLSILSAIFSALVTPLAAALCTLWADWRLGVLMLLLFPLLLPVYRWRRPAFARGMRQLDVAHQRVSADVLEYMQGLCALRAACAEGEKAQTLQQGFIELQQAQTIAQQKGSKPALLISTLMELGLLLIAALSIYWVAQGSLTMALSAAAMVLMVRFAEPLANFISYTAILELIENALNKVEQLLAEKPLAQMQPQQIPQTFDMQFKQVSFRYTSDRPPALQTINLYIPPRRMTALVGSSGSGKSTLARLLLRHFDAQEGSVQIGGVDVRQIPPEQLNRLISVVFQDVYLFDDTVLVNIQMARPEASRAEVEQAAKMAQCDFIERLPQGWDTRLGDMGGKLSGGERQRISIARALLKDAPIVILDEPTAALDSQSERAVQRALDALVEEKTVIVIAHRLSTIAAAGQIIVLEGGQIVQSGTHEALLQQQGRYARLWQAQQSVKNWQV